ncbi:hypothetical protein AVI51_04145 [Piscirickettsia salmonis]|uniref:Intracellular multiplication protein IcmP n=1 Tax=Piscirickettsia salmonis TaxID=1238 RepID=A0A9Q6LJZ8_PISSA|nr:type IVB secretion system coupling complex protein DotM/IcmP [Piscirickettsia salmonis]ALA25298.1 type IV secretion system protein IcmP [Piscirickettsia salmonis]APS45534.1 hypothetical protein AVI48_14900 [Piscirickettsia salmonis]APS46191.1 hypothetical protein AVI49_00120 [Piscirickettsia salmonis]APS50122.1 hypothetical protein AVI50_04185 [Piscirickettsia salmonis]APS53322.1 hypothetical protein AVI51_04145 [Piscirickettsia salmonis]
MQNDQGGGVPHVIYYTIAIAILACAIFIYFHDAVVRIILPFKLFELKIVGFTTNQLNYLSHWAKNTPTIAVTAQDLYTLSNIIGLTLRWLSVPVALITIVLLWRFHPANKLSTTHDMNSLLQSMQTVFPETQPIVGKHLDAEEINKGLWRMASTPVEFMREHHLLKANKTIDQGLAVEVFIKQLGAVWVGEEKLSTMEKAVFGILAAYACYDRSEADKAANEISFSAQKDNLNFTLALQLFEQYKAEEKIEKIIQSHHYVYTIFSSLLESARKSGTVSTAALLWLKAQHRSLWYCLNNVGRQAVFVEAAAVRSHWLVEKALAGPVAMPMVDRAIHGLNAVFKTVEIE